MDIISYFIMIFIFWLLNNEKSFTITFLLSFYNGKLTI